MIRTYRKSRRYAKRYRRRYSRRFRRGGVTINNKQGDTGVARLPTLKAPGLQVNKVTTNVAAIAGAVNQTNASINSYGGLIGFTLSNKYAVGKYNIGNPLITPYAYVDNSYQWWRLTGIKLRFTPARQVGTGPLAASNPLSTACCVSWDWDWTNSTGQSFLPNYATSLAEWNAFTERARTIDNFKTISYTEPTELNINLVKYFKGQMIGWQTTGSGVNDGYGGCQFTVLFYYLSYFPVAVASQPGTLSLANWGNLELDMYFQYANKGPSQVNLQPALQDIDKMESDSDQDIVEVVKRIQLKTPDESQLLQKRSKKIK